MSTITSAIKNFVADENGVTAIEYGLIAALIGVAVAASAKLVGTDIREAFEFIAEQMPNTYAP
jgi:pilus assembly protein Flp/PilA